MGIDSEDGLLQGPLHDARWNRDHAAKAAANSSSPADVEAADLTRSPISSVQDGAVMGQQERTDRTDRTSGRPGNVRRRMPTIHEPAPASRPESSAGVLVDPDAVTNISEDESDRGTEPDHRDDTTASPKSVRPEATERHRVTPASGEYGLGPDGLFTDTDDIGPDPLGLGPEDESARESRKSTGTAPQSPLGNQGIRSHEEESGEHEGNYRHMH